MSKISTSPKIALRPSRSIAEPVTLSKLPNIKDKNTSKKTEILIPDSRTETITQKLSPRPINFYDIPTPVNERKVDIVRSFLEKKKGAKSKSSLQGQDEKPLNPRQDEKTELQLQIDFLSSKSNLKQTESKESLSLETQKLTEDTSIEPIIKSESMVALSPFSTYKSCTDSTIGTSLEEDRSSKLLKCENFMLKEQNLTYQQDLIAQKKSFDEYYQNFNEEKKAFLREIESLKSQILTLTESFNHAKVQINKLKLEKIKLKTDLQDSQTSNSDSTALLEKRLASVSELLNQRDIENDNIKEQIKAAELSRRKSVETSKELEFELMSTRKAKENAEKGLTDIKHKYESLLDELRLERNKAVEVDDLRQDVHQVNYEISLIKEENKSLKFFKKITEESLETLQKNFDNAKLSWREKENAYNSSIQDLLEQISSEKAKTQVQAAETAKLRRALTIRDMDSFGNSPREEANKYQQRLMQIEKEHGETLAELDKVKRCIEYYRHIIKNKEEIIKKLEPSSRTEKKSLIKDLQKMIECDKCLNTGENFCFETCGHLLCATCKGEPNICGFCNTTSDKIYTYCDTENSILIGNLIQKMT